jgi:hypothetical protein
MNSRTAGNAGRNQGQVMSSRTAAAFQGIWATHVGSANGLTMPPSAAYEERMRVLKEVPLLGFFRRGLLVLLGEQLYW